jgi:hypothetical protein
MAFILLLLHRRLCELRLLPPLGRCWGGVEHTAGCEEKLCCACVAIVGVVVVIVVVVL